MNNIEIDLGSCICIHGHLQFVDCIMQSLLYQRAFIPALIPQILDGKTQQEMKFSETYHKVILLKIR